jgi:hypothetical protein
MDDLSRVGRVPVSLQGTETHAGFQVVRPTVSITGVVRTGKLSVHALFC